MEGAKAWLVKVKCFNWNDEMRQLAWQVTDATAISSDNELFQNFLNKLMPQLFDTAHSVNFWRAGAASGTQTAIYLETARFARKSWDSKLDQQGDSTRAIEEFMVLPNKLLEPYDDERLTTAVRAFIDFLAECSSSKPRPYKILNTCHMASLKA